MKWTKKIHPGWKKMQDYKELNLKDLYHKWQYISNGYDIVGPSYATFGKWEAYNGKDTPRFDTLKEAKEWCESDNLKL